MDSEVYISNYSILRLDRNRHGGGVALYVHNSLLYDVLLCGPAGLELIVVSLFRNHFKFCIGVFYRPPSSSPAIFDLLCSSLFQYVHQSYFSNFVIVGDFNVDFISTHPLYAHLSDFMTIFCLSQILDSPTHFSSTGKPSLIDLVFVSNLHSCLNCTTIPQLANSDHLGLFLSMKTNLQPLNSFPRRRVWRYNHADFQTANEMLCDMDLNDIMDPTNIQTSWLCFKTAFLDVMEQCIPQSVVPNRQNLPWLTKTIIQLIKKRNYYFKRAYHSGSSIDYSKFKQLRNKVVSDLRLAKQRFFSNLHPQNSKEFWKVISALSPRESSFPSLKNGNIIANSGLDKANLLNITFTNHYNRSVPELSISDLPKVVPTDCPDDIFCSEDEVYELLCTLDTTKSSGDDDISARMLKETALSITPAVTQLFNISLKLGAIPDEWKVARVSPIPKSHNKSDPGSYRPISLLSVLSKLLEKHVRNLLVDHLEKFHPLSAQQWGFTRGKSTTGALLAATDSWHKLLDSGLDICTVFFDFSKAFDTVPHRPLLQKLKDLNVHSYILKWLTNYLSFRYQYVCVDSYSSDVLPVYSGVPQGSVLGPLLFIVYVNDITMIPLSDGTISLYADDILLYRPIYTHNDYHLLQGDVNNICTWADINNLKFNSTKCKYMIISRKKQPTIPVSPLLINDCCLERVKSYKYLGVWITSTLNWSTHISEICTKARRQVGIIFRKFYGHASSSTLLQLYLTFVRPHLEYAVPVWDPHQQGLSYSLERVQKFALRMCMRDWNADYATLLQSCNLSTLASRRRYLKLCFLYRVIQGEFDFPGAPIARRNLSLNLRNNSAFLLLRPPTCSSAHQFSFFPHTIELWNSLPPSVHSCDSLSSFKRLLLQLNCV